MNAIGNRLWAVGLAALIATSLAGSVPAQAGPRGGSYRDGPGDREYPRYRTGDREHPRYRTGKWSYTHRGQGVGFVVVRRPRLVVVRPAYAHWFVVRRPRFVVVRPVPCWPASYGSGVAARVGLRAGGVRLDFGFERRDPYYGCDFCGAYFPDYGGWEEHVLGCPRRPTGPVFCEPWESGDVDGFRESAARAWRDDDGGAGRQGYGEDE